MRVFYDPSRDSIFIEGAKDVYPDRSLEAYDAGSDRVAMRIANGGVNILGPVPYTAIQDISGSGFATAALTLAYLQAQTVPKDRDGPRDTEPIQHDQTTPSADWIIAHNLGRKPGSIEVYVGGCLVDAAVINLDLNVLQVCFNSPQTGCVTII